MQSLSCAERRVRSINPRVMRAIGSTCLRSSTGTAPTTTLKMSSKCFVLLVVLLALGQLLQGCLITNCPRGGKRSGKYLPEANVKPCVSCGPGHSGQCFGPNICCGPFGCLMSTPETARCQRDGMFMEREPCIAGSAPCRRNTGRCAADGVCCSQDSCYADKACASDARYDVYNFVNAEYTA